MSRLQDNFFSKSLAVIPSRWKKGLALIALGIIFTSLIETGAMGIIAVFVSSISDPDIITRSSKLRSIVDMLPATFFATPAHTITTLGGAACVLIIIKNASSFLVTYAYSSLSARMDAMFGAKLMKNYICHEYEWHVSRHSADLVTAGTWRKYISPVWYMAILALNDMVLVAMLGLALLYAAPVISIFTIGAFGLMAAVIFFVLRPKIDREAKAIAQLEQSINKRTSDITQGIKEILISSKQQYFFDHYQHDVVTSSIAQARILLLTRIPSWLFETIGFLLLCGTVIFAVAVNENVSASVISGKLAMLGIVAWRTLPAFNRIVSSLSALRDNLPKAESVINAIADLPEKNYPSTPPAPLKLNKSLRINSLDFTYTGTAGQALSDINLTIASGKTVGLIGKSGSGKSTLADVIIGLITPTSGTIYIDDIPLVPDIRNNWVASVGYVGQSPFFTDGSILENVAFGIPSDQIDREKLMRCCRMAALEDLISQLPGGVDQPLGERAAKLSGGQRQRVAIARALYRAPQLLILDEATSALDQQSENTIKKTVNNLSGSLTMLIIAHRLTTVEHCDTVVWLENGKIVMDGTPAEVLPFYRANLSTEHC